MTKQIYISGIFIAWLLFACGQPVYTQSKLEERIRDFSTKTNELVEKGVSRIANDSVMQTSVEDRIRELSQKANQFIQQTDFLLAKDTLEKALELIPATTEIDIKSSIQHQAALSYALTSDTINAIQYFLKANDTYKRQNDSMGMYLVNKDLADLFYELQAYQKSMEYYHTALDYFNKPAQKDSEAEQAQIHYADCFMALHQLDSAALIYESLLYKYHKQADVQSEIDMLYRLSHIYEQQQRYHKAIPIHQHLYTYYDSTGNEVKTVEALNNLGYNFVLLNQYDDAKNAFALAEDNMKADSFSLDFRASLYANLGICYQNINQYQEAIPYLLQSLELRKQEQNTKELAIVNQMLALTYYRFGDLYNANQYALEALALSKLTTDRKLESSCYKTCSTISQAMEEHENALQYYSRYLLIQDSLMRAEREQSRLLNERIFELEKREKELQLQIAEDNVKDILLEQLQLKAKQREQENEILRQQAALQASEQERIQQSLLLVQQQKDALEKQSEIENLENERQLQENALKLKEAQEKEQAKAYALLEAEKEKQSIELQNQELILKQQAERAQKFKWIMGLAIVIIAMAILFVIHTRRKNRLLSKQKAEIEEKNEELFSKNEEINTQAEHLRETNNELTQKNDEIKAQRDDLQLKNVKIEEQAKQIISSIQYAQKIQEAVLPDKLQLKELIPEHFVLFRPRDIVSGDFYWIRQIKNSIYATVADCTGHGVPGAFMSMLGTAFLNEITGQAEELTPAQILGELRDKVKKSLKQVGKSGEAKDGMDMAMLKIDMQAKTVTFAGAHNGLIQIRHNPDTNEAEMYNHKADRMPIGIYLRERDFTDHNIDVKPGDILYMYSDGFVDQFGGETGMKYKTKRFKELLQTICNEELSFQRDALETEIVDWMGDKHSQIDDICIMGIRISENYGDAELF